jgi:hypothetical protein
MGGKYSSRQPMMACLFHGSTSAAVLEAMPLLNVHQQTLQRALAFDYPWRDHRIFVTHKDPNTEKPNVTGKEVLAALRTTHNMHANNAHDNTPTHQTHTE